jgi:ectoine hydroxylase-related dioxygenase (phytanoyl-CoA dioxygenase family)
MLTEAERAFFSAHGYLVLRAVIAPARVDKLEQALDRVHQGYTAFAPTPPGEVWEVPGIGRAAPLLAEHARDRAIAQRAGEALGCARVQLLQDTALIKAARVGGPVAWHQDHTYTGYLSPARVVTARLALTRCTAANGCMEVLGGSHRWGLLGEVRALTERSVADALGDRADGSASEVVRLELEPGDVTLHHCLTFHRSGPNASDESRKTLITRLFDGACTLVKEKLPPGGESHFPCDEQGRLSEAAFPILWERGA